jgi:hypothetical protein
MRCAECGLYECCMRTPLGGCPNGEKAEPMEIATTTNTTVAAFVNVDAAMKSLKEKIKKATHTWQEVDVERYLAEVRGVNVDLIDAAQDLVDAVERYVEPKPGQEFVHWSEILLKKNALKAILK